MQPLSKKKLLPFMTYLEEDEHKRLKKFAKSQRMTMAAVVREGIFMRMNSDKHPYLNGFNDGLNKADTIIKELPASQMRFPSGKSFSELASDELFKHTMKV
jgi:hypothetical protein